MFVQNKFDAIFVTHVYAYEIIGFLVFTSFEWLVRDSSIVNYVGDKLCLI